jgi:bacterioferritin-associated ferredoxin
MYICVCNGITENEVRRCVRRGAASLMELQMELGVACNCGKCAATAVAIVEEETSAPAGCGSLLGCSAPA